MRYYPHARRADGGAGIAYAPVRGVKNVLRLVSTVNIVTA